MLGVKNDTADTAFLVGVRIARQPGGPCSKIFPVAVMGPGAYKQYTIPTLKDLSAGTDANAVTPRTQNFLFLPAGRIAFVQVYTAMLTEVDAIPSTVQALWADGAADEADWQLNFWEELASAGAGATNYQPKIIQQSINCLTMTVNTCIGTDIQEMTLAGAGAAHSVTVGLGGTGPSAGKSYIVSGAPRRQPGQPSTMQVTLHNNTNAPSQDYQFPSEKVRSATNKWGRWSLGFLVVGLGLSIAAIYLYFSHRRHFPVNHKQTLKALGAARDSSMSHTAHSSSAARGTGHGSSYSARNAANTMQVPGAHNQPAVHLSGMIPADA